MRPLFQRLFLSACTVFAASSAAAVDDEVIIDPASERILTDACSHLRSASRIGVDIETEYEEVLLDGTTVTYHRDDTVLLQRPDRLRIDVLDDKGLRQIFVGAEKIVIHRPMSAAYAQIDTSGTLSERLTNMEAKGISLPLDDLLNDKPCSDLVEHMQTVTFAGRHYIDGRLADHLLIATDHANLQLWVDSGNEPEFVKLVIHYRALTGQPRFTARFANWDLRHNDNREFSFDPPEGTRLIEFRKSSSAQGGE